MEESLLTRQLPYSLEAEQAVLGAILLDPERINDITGAVFEDDFYVDKHKAIYGIMRDLFVESRTIDPVTVLNHLVENNVYNEQSGSLYIKQLVDTVPSTSNIADYAKIVHDKALLRKLIDASEKIQQKAFEPGGDSAQEVLDSAEQAVFDLAQGFVKNDFSHIKEIIYECYSVLDQLKKDKQSLIGTPTYYQVIDNVLVGLGAGDLVVVGARPGMGKTSFATNIATRIARNSKKTVAIFSLEMSKVQIVNRILSSEARIDSYKMRKGDLDEADFDRLSTAATALSYTNIYVDDTSKITVSEMRAKLRRLKDLGLVIVDYLQLMESEKHSDSRALEVGEISRAMKVMAKDMQVPIICCAQLNRGVESDGKVRKPRLSDLRDSGAIEQDADIVLFLHRDSYYNGTEDNSAVCEAECIVAKNRHGESRTITLGWEPSFTRFTEIDNSHTEM